MRSHTTTSIRGIRRIRRIRSVRSGAAGLVLVLLFAALPTLVSAQSQTELPTDGGPEARHPEAAEAIGKLWSPYCPGFMLEVCSSTQGAALRDSIQTMAEQGATSEEIVDWMEANHGEEYLAVPRGGGASLLAWVAPPLAVLLGLITVVLILRRMMAVRRAEAPAGEPAELTEEEEERLRRAVRDVDQQEEAPLF